MYTEKKKPKIFVNYIFFICLTSSSFFSSMHILMIVINHTKKSEKVNFDLSNRALFDIYQTTAKKILQRFLFRMSLLCSPSSYSIC